MERCLRCLVAISAFLTFTLTNSQGQVRKVDDFSQYVNMTQTPDSINDFIDLKTLIDVSRYNINDLVQASFRKLSSGMADDALKGFDQVTIENPDSEIGYFGKGFCWWSIGKIDSAIYYLEKAVSKNQKFGPSYLTLGQIYLNQRDARSAERYLTEARKWMPSSPEPLMLLAISSSIRHDFETAMLLAIEAVSKNDKYIPALVLAGKLFMNAGNLPKAIEYFNKAIDLDPANISALEMRATAYMSMNDVQRSIKDFSSLIRISSSEPYHYLMRSQLYFKVKAYDSLILDVEKYYQLPYSMRMIFIPITLQTKNGTDKLVSLLATEIRDGHHKPAILEAASLMLYQETESAIGKINKYIKKNPEDGIAYYIQGAIYETLRQYKKAFESYETAVRYTPSRPESYIRMGEIALMQFGDLDKVEEIFSNLLVIDSKNFHAHKYLAALFINNKTLDSALKHVTEAFKLDPTNADILYYKSQVHKMEGDIDNYREALEQAAVRKYSDPAIWFELTDVTLASADSVKALKYISEGLKYDQYNSLRFNQRGLLNCSAGNYEQAAQDFDRVQMLSRGSTEATLNAAMCLYAQKKYSEAMSKLAVLGLNITDPEIPLLNGLCWMGLGEKDKAALEFTRAKNMGLSDWQHYMSMLEQ